MGVTIQFESHRVELAFIHEMEHDPEVLEYYDQPPAIPLEYLSARGRRVAVTHTPDYFVIRRDGAGWVECKTEEELAILAEKKPNRYRQGGDGRWHCPPGEAYGGRFNLGYRVRSSAEINWIYQRNIQFLEDYFRFDGVATVGAQDLVLREVTAEPGLSLGELYRRSSEGASRDDIHSLIASGMLYVALDKEPLAEPDKAHVFPSRGMSVAYERVGNACRAIRSPFVDVAPGSSLTWDGRAWTVANVGDSRISLIAEDHSFAEIQNSLFETLVKQGRITGVGTSPRHSEVALVLASASEQDLKTANDRFDLVHRHIKVGLSAGELQVCDRTLRLWTAQFQRAEEKYGSGYLGLLPRTSCRGNRTPRLPEETRRLLSEFIERDYETMKQRSKFASWARLKSACEQSGVVAPSYMTFCLAVRRRPEFVRTLKRQGRRAAYIHEPFWWELSITTPRHGDRPFEIGHIDHTELDVEVICSQTSRTLGRPWMTLVTDAFSRRVLAVYVTFDEPSYRSCMMALRECVRRHARLPQICVVDGGPEFKSTYFETLLARYECVKKTRPPAKARFGSVLERLFGTTNTRFIYNLKGNTQITRNVRQVTKSVDPKQHATWTLGELQEKLCFYLFEVYDTIEHPALGQSPREAFSSGLEKAGSRPQRMIPFDRDFLICTLPSTRKGTAKVLPGRGVKINHIYYWSDAFRDPGIERREVPVRYEPFDVGTAYAFVGRQWIQCHSEHYAAFQGHSEREVMLASNELRRRHQRHSGQLNITAGKLANLLQAIEIDEALLMQRVRDRESRIVRSGLAPAIAAPLEGTDDQKNGVDHRDETPETYEMYGEF
jgi:transposase InsO family protein